MRARTRQELNGLDYRLGSLYKDVEALADRLHHIEIQVLRAGGTELAVGGLIGAVADCNKMQRQKEHWTDKGHKWLDEYLTELFAPLTPKQVEMTLEFWDTLGVKERMLARFKVLTRPSPDSQTNWPPAL